MTDQPAPKPEWETRAIPRRRFLRRVATTLAAGTGLALIQFGEAQARPCSSCCPDTSCTKSCTGHGAKYRCQPGNCCICHMNVGCFSTGACQC
jgi:hypothetical protein